MNKQQIAKELTIAALEVKIIEPTVSSYENYLDLNEKIAENVAAFYNKLIEKLNIEE